MACVPAADDSKLRVAKMLEHQVGLQMILHDHASDAFLPDDKVIEFKRHMNTMLLTYQSLAADADRDLLLLWNQPTKFHWVWHLGDRSKYLNPRNGNAMVDEDFVG